MLKWNIQHPSKRYNLYNLIIVAARDLVEHLLVVDIKKRYTAQEVLCHPWILNGGDTMTMPDRETMDEMSREMKASLDAERISLEDSRKTKQG